MLGSGISRTLTLTPRIPARCRSTSASTHCEFGGAQYDFEEDHVTGRFVSWAFLETVLGHTLNTAVRETTQ